MFLSHKLRRLVHKTRAGMTLVRKRKLPEVTVRPLDLLLAILDHGGEETTIVQVGACDGITRDPLHHYIVKGRTKAFLLEPNPQAFVRLQKAYAGVENATLIEAAIGDHDGEAALYRLKSSNNPGLDDDLGLQISSFSRDHLLKHGARQNAIERISVPCCTLSSLADKFGLTHINLLQIDAEGFDAEVVMMALGLKVRPDAINFEHVHLRAADRESVFDALRAAGYCFGCDDWNILAIQESLFERLKNGPGPKRVRPQLTSAANPLPALQSSGNGLREGSEIYGLP